MRAALKSTGTLVNPLEVAGDLFLSIVAVILALDPVSLVAVTVIRAKGFERMFSVANALPVFVTERTIAEVFVFESHLLWDLRYASHIPKNIN